MSFVLIFDPDPILGDAPRFFGPFATREAARRYAEAKDMTGGVDFDTAAAQADAEEGRYGHSGSFACAIALIEPVDGTAFPVDGEPS
jgi:hypothetical protein